MSKKMACAHWQEGLPRPSCENIHAHIDWGSNHLGSCLSYRLEETSGAGERDSKDFITTQPLEVENDD